MPSKENTALRAGVDPNRIFVIPNAVDTDIFRPLSTAPSVVKPTKECTCFFTNHLCNLTKTPFFPLLTHQ